MRRIFFQIVALGSMVAPVAVYAQTKLSVGLGTSYNFWQIMNRIITYLAGAITAISLTMFLVGALMITVSGVKEDMKQKGKDLIFGSLISLAVVAGAYSLLRLVSYLLQ